MRTSSKLLIAAWAFVAGIGIANQVTSENYSDQEKIQMYKAYAVANETCLKDEFSKSLGLWDLNTSESEREQEAKDARIKSLYACNVGDFPRFVQDWFVEGVNLPPKCRVCE